MAQAPSAVQAGTLDPTFADHGVLSMEFPEISGHLALAVLALPDKKLIVVIPLLGFPAPLAIARLNEDGSLDTGFGGAGAGYVEVALKGAVISFVWGISGSSDGGWLIVGQYESNDLSGAGLVLLRHHADGTPDKSFGEQGVRLIPYLDLGRPGDAGVKVTAEGQDESRSGTGQSRAASPAGASAIQQLDGKIALVHSVSTDSGQRGIVLRLNPDGSTDDTFNGTGFAIVELEGIAHDWNSCRGVAVQADGKILVSGMYVQEAPESIGAFVTRFDVMGRVDRRFNGGTVTVPYPRLIDFAAISVRATDGRIVLAGRAVSPERISNGLIVVITTDGFFDFSFNRGQPLFSELVLQGLGWERCVLQTDGSILVSGFTGAGFVTEELAAVTARYLPEGILDPTFNGNGFTVFQTQEGMADERGVTVMTDGRIVVCGVVWKSADPLPYMIGGWVIRYLA